MTAAQTDIKKLAGDVLTILRDEGQMIAAETIQFRLKEKNIKASLTNIIKITDAIDTIHNLIIKFGFDLPTLLALK